MAINDPIPPSFPGLRDPVYSGAPGSEPNGSPEFDDVAATITPPSGVWYGRPTVSTHGTTIQGQNDDGFNLVTNADITDTGAGNGSQGTHFHRYDWQQPDGTQ